MRLSLRIFSYKLNFKLPAGTSRGVLKEKLSYIVQLKGNNKVGYGEISTLPNLSLDAATDFEEIIANSIGNQITEQQLLDFLPTITTYPALRFALETALLDWQQGGNQVLFATSFSEKEEGITINGLIWMGEVDFMLSQIADKLDKGFTCLKMKIGAINFEEELHILKSIRKRFSAQDLEVRADANGAFSFEESLIKLQKLAALQLHSIEQPIRQGQIENMAKLCANTPLAIALDEELIGNASRKEVLLDAIKPQYIILKPSLIGGFQESDAWISVAEKRNIGWWITSALESNVGLNAIAQYASQFKLTMPQGLGTGQLFTNNVVSPLEIRGEKLFYDKAKKWDFSFLENE